MAVNQKPLRTAGGDLSGGELIVPGRALAPLVCAGSGGGRPLPVSTRTGSIWNPAVEELLGLADLILLDVKQADPERHLAPTERDNAQTSQGTAAWL